MPRLRIINGPNLNIMGRRRNAAYRGMRLEDVEAMVRRHAGALGVEVDFLQSNSEAEIVTWIHECLDGIDGVVINPTALTHTSWAIADALAALDCPVIELHFSNVYRDPSKAERRVSLVRASATGVIAGFGPNGYIAALDLLDTMISQTGEETDT